MASSPTQEKKPISSNSNLIGSFYSSRTGTQTATACGACHVQLPLQAKFCGECGAGASEVKQNNAFTNPNLGSGYLNQQRAQVAGLPNFAQVSPQMRKAISPQLKQEYCKVITLLARERIFLVMHYTLFLLANLFGFWCAYTAYTGLNADEVTRMVVAFIPLLCINALAFACFVCINGTKREISRLKERVTYLHYQIEYVNLS